MDDNNHLNISLCVFNGDLTKLWTKKFGMLTLSREDLVRLNEIPTPNIALKCAFIIDGHFIKICKVIEVDTENQEIVDEVMWNLGKTKSNTHTTHKKIIDAKGFITGLTSIFIPAHFSKTFVLPVHDRKFHSIGREADCNLVYNNFLNCYVVSSMNPRSTIHYQTMLKRKSDNVEGIFYIELNLNNFRNGFYTHEQFKMVADPFGFLDLSYFAYNASPEKKRQIYKVPIKDRLSKKYETRNLKDLDLITRFEITSSGDEKEQIELIKNLQSNKANLTGGGIVVNAKSGIVCGHNFNGIVFKLSENHTYSTGSSIVFKASRSVEPEISRPTFLITDSKPKPLKDGKTHFCTYENEKFKFNAKYIAEFNCYEALEMFGFIPCKTPPPSKSATKDQIYEITAIENTHLPGQTVLIHGEFVREATVTDD